MTLKEQVVNIKTMCGQIALGNGRCFICDCKTAKRGMVIHHLWYIKHDVVYKDYPDNDSGRLAYYTKLLPLIKRNPKRFVYLCNTHHQAVERLCRYGDKILNKLLMLRRMTLAKR